jgi:putative heme iron utilization protein
METSPDDVASVHALLATERHGVLCTAHARHGGWPFGSVAPFALTPRRDPVFLFSTIAEHTRNLLADARASLLVQDRAALDQPLAGARATLMGSAEAPEGRARRELLDSYLARFPEAEEWATAHDFVPFVLRVERVRWILGFGSMGWLERLDGS